MAGSTSERTPEWWLERLFKARSVKYKAPQGSGRKSQMLSRREDLDRNEWLNYQYNYHTGEYLRPEEDDWAKASKLLSQLGRTNYAGLVNTALADRVRFMGVRVVNTSEMPAADGHTESGDPQIRKALASNGSFLVDALDFTVAVGEGYVMVGPPAAPGLPAVATCEDPRSIVVATDIRNPDDLRAVVKIYTDDMAGEDVIALYLAAGALGPNSPDSLYTYRREMSAAGGGVGTFSLKDWTLVDEDPALPVQGLGVPFVRLANKREQGEATAHLDLIDRIQNDIVDRLWALKYQIYNQRAAIGNLPKYDENGEKVDYQTLLQSDPGALWRVPAGTEFWESRAADIRAILEPAREDVRELSAVSQTPLPAILTDSVNGSAEGASLSREGISFKAEALCTRLTPAMLKLARLLLAYSGSGEETVTASVGGVATQVPKVAGSDEQRLKEIKSLELEALWGPVERLTLSQRLAAARDAVQAGVPKRAIWADIIQADPATVARWEMNAEDEAFLDTLSSAPAAPVATAPATVAPAPVAPAPAATAPVATAPAAMEVTGG